MKTKYERIPRKKKKLLKKRKAAFSEMLLSGKPFITSSSAFGFQFHYLNFIKHPIK